MCATRPDDVTGLPGEEGSTGNGETDGGEGGETEVPGTGENGSTDPVDNNNGSTDPTDQPLDPTVTEL